MKNKKTKAEESESSSEVDWRQLLLNEAEWRIQLLAMLERIATTMKIDLISMIAITLMALAVIVATIYITITERDECLNEPLVYGAKIMEQRFGYEFYGSGSFMVPAGKRSPIIIFNSHNITID